MTMRMRRTTLALALIVTLMNPSCQVRTRTKPIRVNSPFESARIAFNPFDYIRDSDRNQRPIQVTKESDRRLSLELPSRLDLKGAFECVTAQVFLPEVTPAPALLVLPILGGDYWIAQHIAESFAELGFIAAFAERRGEFLDPENSLDESRDGYIAQVIDARRVLDWIESSNLVNDGEIALFGVSRGGIIGTLVASVDSRIKASTIAIAGGDLVTILEQSTERDVRRFRDSQVRRFDHSFDRFREEARRAMIDVDPMIYALGLDRDSVLMISARFDTVIPKQSSEALWRAAGRPKLLILPTTHETAFFFLGHCIARAEEHFRSRFR